MKTVVVIEHQKYHLFSAYAPQTGCSEQTKDTFWNLLDEKTAEVPLQEAIVVAALLPAVTTVDETWKGTAEAIAWVARSKLCVTKPGRRKLDKQTWLWTDHVRDKVREKKKQYHAFLIEKTADNWQRYQIAKEEAKKAVAFEKAAHYADLNKKLEPRDGSEHLTADSSEPGSIKINGTELTRTTTFKYLGSAIASDGSLGFETNSRVNAAWLKWRSMTGVLCDRKILERLKSKTYRTVIWPVAIYGAECWSATKEVEARLSVLETKMLRWTAGVTRLDRISNDAIRELFGVAPIVDKMREARLRWYGHTLRAKNDSAPKIGLNLDVS
nr:endonuclease-reverse transcriptase [Haemonchus contortus]